MKPVILSAALACLAAFAQAPPGRARADSPAFDRFAKSADQARDAGKLDEAVLLYNKALKINPAWEDGWWALGSIAYDRDKYADCVPAFRRLAALKPGLADAWTMAGLCEYRLRDFEAAMDSLSRAERLGFNQNPELARQSRLHLAILLTRSGSFERAIVLLTELVRLDRKTPEIAMIAGIAGLRRASLPSEIPASDRERVWRLGDAMASAMEQDNAAATERFAAAVQVFPEDPDIRFRYGAFLRLADLDKGVAEIKKAVELKPDHIPALVGLAMIYTKNGEPQTAREYAARAVKADPNDFAARIALGRALLDSEDPAGAARELERAVRLAPGSPEAHFSLAAAYARLGRKNDADRQNAAFKRLKQEARQDAGSLRN